MRIIAIATCLSVAGTAMADPAPLPPPAVPSPAPQLTIVSPQLDERLVGKPSPTPDDKYTDMSCLQDSRKFGIKITSQDWTVRPGGPGVLVVVDGLYAANVHDLSKPVLVADLAPYETHQLAQHSPMSGCGFHWVAVTPTAADGRLLPVAPVTSWWENVPPSQASGDQFPEQPQYTEARHNGVLAVVNWPLLGKPFFGAMWEGHETKAEPRSGVILKDPKRATFDWVLTGERASTPRCSFDVHSTDKDGQWRENLSLPSHGTVDLPDAFLGQGFIVAAQNCGAGNYYAKLWATSPPPFAHAKYPPPGQGAAKDYWRSTAGHHQVQVMIDSYKASCDKGDADACEKYHRWSGK